MLRAYKELASKLILDGKLGIPKIFTPLSSMVLLSCDTAQLPPFSMAISTITAPFFIDSTICLVMSKGAGFPGRSAVVMTRSAFFNSSAILAC